jgi:uncharacterized protein YqjF (DUF2071 family)
VIFRSELRDALWVNWALPRALLDPPPEPLVLDTLGRGESEVAFVSLVLFRNSGLRRRGLPWPRLSFPQCNLRVLVRDDERVASIWILRELMPAWAVPVARLFARQPAAAAIFQIASAPGGEQRWAVAAGARLALVARPGAPAPPAPLPGNWNDVMAFFRERPRGYVAAARGLRRLSAAHPAVAGIPMRVEMEAVDWLERRLPRVGAERWLRPHSAFMIPSIRLTVAIESGLEPARGEELPAPGRPAVT